jgi:hypothetical protein
MSCVKVVRPAQCVTSEMLASSWPETEHRLHVFRATNGIHIGIC